MKILKTIFLLLVISISTSWAQNPTFKITPDAPAPGDDVMLHFDASQGALSGVDEVSARVYSFCDYAWYAEDIELESKEKDQWTAQYHIKPETAFIACVFVSDTLIDNGKEVAHGWIIQKMPGAYTAWGISRSGAFKDEVPEIIEDQYRIDDAVALMWINNELRDFPQAREHVFYYGLKLMTLVKDGDHPARIKKEVKHVLSSELDNKQQYDIQRTLKLLPQDDEKIFIDSVSEVLVKKYPQGVLARDNEILRISKAPDKKKVTEKDIKSLLKISLKKHLKMYIQM
ncbi:hypothetical protein LVD15_19115 [Fulvivirga maritima]|uniref:hypothetical protein n=1 Tax=Fulvivirga maritima TaxID=2904247 RepID=UPI001F1E6835|nr:hypothetical protein [Fulvivirga maritima]UII25397.1 hypothetical protein LVD15_19115 [Fulvivirga maritima]